MGTRTATSLSLEDAVAPQLHQLLRARIVSCDLTPGQRISETAIASTYDVSRQPVREAFIKLAEEKLVTIRPQRGTFIQRISVPAVRTARFIREAVEADIVRHAAENITPDGLRVLDDILTQQYRAVEAGDRGEFMRLDELFHKTLAELAGMPAVSGYLDGLIVQMNRVRNISAREFSPGNLIAQHAAIVDALRQGDATTAEAAIRQHLREINRDLPRIIATYPDYFEGTEA